MDLLLHDGDGHRAIGNLLTTRNQLAEAIGLEAESTERITDPMIEAIAHPLKTQPVQVGRASEVVVDQADLTRLPFQHAFERETGKTLPAALSV